MAILEYRYVHVVDLRVHVQVQYLSGIDDGFPYPD